MSHECVVWWSPSIEGWLGAPLQAGKIWIFTLLCRPVDLGRLALDAARFLLTLLLLTGFLTVSLSGCGFACSSDDVLLSVQCAYESLSGATLASSHRRFGSRFRTSILLTRAGEGVGTQSLTGG